MNTFQRWRLGLVLAILASVGALMACDVNDPASLGTIRFNDKKIDFYWYGTRIQSPAHFKWSEHGLVVNGIDASQAPPPDTTGSAVRLAPAFQHVPYVDSLVASGQDWVSAVDALGCEFPRRIRRAILDERVKARTEDRAVDVLAIQKAIVRSTALPMDSVLAYRGWLYCSVPGGARFDINLEWSDAELERDPCAERTKVVTREACETSVKHLRVWLIAHYASLIIADDDGMQTFSGAQARRGKAELALLESDYAKGGAAAVRARLQSGKALVSARSALMIAQRAASQPD